VREGERERERESERIAAMAGVEGDSDNE